LSVPDDDPDVTLYDSIADLPLTIESSDRVRHERETSSDFTRVTTELRLHGDGVTGRGEDVCYDVEDHDALEGAPPFVASTGDAAGRIAPGTYTFDDYSRALDDVELFPDHEPERESAHHYRRWCLESAGLDLALRQSGRSLGAALGLSADPVRFVVSTRLPDGEPDRVEAILDAYPGTEFKLDPTPEWTDEAFDVLAASGAVRLLDLKGLYEGTSVDQEPDPDFYRRVLGTFPDAVIEDPATVPGTEELLAANADRLSWDVPITDVGSLRSRPYEPRWCNVKPSRFGTVASLLETIGYCREQGIRMYGGGQFELGVGRDQVQAIASLFYADGPNDVAPGGYNDPEVREGLPTSPLPAADDDPGIA